MADRPRPPPATSPAGRVVTGVDAAPAGPSVVTVGFFDGVHRGHQAIIARAAAQAREHGVRSAVVTFDRHPAEVVRPGSQPRLLMTLERRTRTLACAVDLVVVLQFDDTLRQLTPEQFADRVLVEPLRARRVVVGANFRFGHRASGDVEGLRRLGPARGFSVEGVPLLADDGGAYSSTAIRAAVEDGDVAAAGRMLGRPYLLDGVVVAGDRRGAALGFPTANLRVSPRLVVPADGVYAGYLHLPGGRSPAAVASVGHNPTFAARERRIEAHALDFSGDLYGAPVTLEFRHRIRDERRFDSAEQLAAAIGADVDRGRELLGASRTPGEGD